MATISSIRTFDIIINNVERAIGRSAINNQMDNIWIILRQNTVERTPQNSSSIVGDCNVGKSHSL